MAATPMAELAQPSPAEFSPWAAPLPQGEGPALRLTRLALVKGAIVGRLEAPARPIWPVVFHLTLNGQEMGRHIANLPGLGFRVALPADLVKAAENHLRLLALDGREATAMLDGLGAPSEPIAPEPIAPEPTAPKPSLAQPAFPQTASPEAHPEDAIPPPATRAGTPPSPVEQARIAGLLEKLEPEQVFALAEAAFKSQDWPVVLALTEHQSNRAKEPRLVTFRGRAFYYLGRHAEAVETLRWLQARHPQRHSALLFLARSLTQLGGLAEAREILARGLAGNPEDPRHVFEAGRVAARLAQGEDGQGELRPELIAEAQGLLRRAARLRPQDERPPRLLAQLALQQGGLSEALVYLQSAVALAPGQLELRLELARVLTRLGRIEEALEEAEAAVALDPLRDGAGFAVRILERWGDARARGAFANNSLPVESAEP